MSHFFKVKVSLMLLLIAFAAIVIIHSSIDTVAPTLSDKEANSSAANLVLLNHKEYLPGQQVHDYILDKLIHVSGLKAKERYWNRVQLLSEEKEFPTNMKGLRKADDLLNRQCFTENVSICLDEYIFKGGHGDVWRAHKLKLDSVNSSDSYSQDSLILKRMKTREDPAILRCALREIYFGNRLQRRESFPSFIRYFIYDEDYWLVFRDEGSSLQSYLYNTGVYGDKVFVPSRAWKKLRTTEIGEASLKSIMFQLISNSAELHDLGIVHRDIKPSNILLQATNKPKLLTSDFSSAVDDVILAGKTINSYYGSSGPSIAEETIDYAPPEVRLSISSDSFGDIQAIPFDSDYPESYDTWSIGIVFLEILLGTPDIFRVDPRTESMIIQLLQKDHIDTPTIRNKVLLLAGLADFGIYRKKLLVNQEQEREEPKNKHGPRLLKKVAAFAREIVSDMKKLLKSSNAIDRPTGAHLAATKLQFQIAQNEADSSNQQQLREDDGEETLFDGPCSLSSIETDDLLQTFHESIVYRDILGVGFHDRWGLDLIARLMCFKPIDRINLKDALSHAYFHGPYTSAYDGQEFATLRELNEYNKKLKSIKEFDDNSVLVSNGDPSYVKSESQKWPILTYSNQVAVSFQDLITEDDNSNNDGHEETYLESSESKKLMTPSTIDRRQSNRLGYSCPKCGKQFENRLSCMHHVHARRHGHFCAYFLNEIDSSARTMTKFSSAIIHHNVVNEFFPLCMPNHTTSVINLDER